MGFNNVEDLLSQRNRLADAIVRKEPLSQLDWLRTLLATSLHLSGMLLALALSGLLQQVFPMPTPSSSYEPFNASWPGTVWAAF